MATAKHPAPLDSNWILNLTQAAWTAFIAANSGAWSHKHVNEWQRMYRIISDAVQTDGVDLAAVPGDAVNRIISKLPSATYRGAYPARMTRYYRWCRDNLTEPAAPEAETAEQDTESEEAAEDTPSTDLPQLLTTLLPPYDVGMGERLHNAALRYLEYGHAVAALQRYVNDGQTA